MAKRFVSQEYSTQTGGRDIRDGTRRSRVGTYMATGFFGFAIIIGVALIAFSAMFFYSDVDGTSMMRTLNASGVNTDSVLVKRGQEAQRGDIIVVQHYDLNGNKSALHIKRLIAMEGDTIYFQQSHDGKYYKMYVNGVAYDSNNAGKYVIFDDNQSRATGDTTDSWGWMRGGDIYNAFYNWQNNGTHRYQSVGYGGNDYRPTDKNGPLFRTYAKDGSTFRWQNPEEGNRWEIKLPAGYVFYMGDNRGNMSGYNMSADCTNYGPQPKSHIVGIAVDKASNKSAPEWFFQKLLSIVTFGAIK